MSILGSWGTATLPDPIFQALPIGSQLLRTEIVTEADGSRVRVDTYTSPFRGTFQLRTFLTQTERRAQLVPINPLLRVVSTAPPQRKEVSVDPNAKKRVDSTADRRSVDRPGRDPRAETIVNGAGGDFGKDRRTGGPWRSFVDELKSFFLRPAGVVTLGLAFVALFAAFAAARK